jgi:hypothetical protein
MSGCKKAVKDFISTIDSSVSKKLCKGALNGAGRRLYPSRTPKNDKQTGFRVDQGRVHDKEGTTYDIVLQPNAESTTPAIKGFISKYSTHAKLATMTIDKNENKGKGPLASEIRAALEEDFKRRDEEEDFS